MPQECGQGQEEPGWLARSRAWSRGMQGRTAREGPLGSQHSSLKCLFLNAHGRILSPLIFREWKGRRKEEEWREGGKEGGKYWCERDILIGCLPKGARNRTHNTSVCGQHYDH